jgi:hypothetical protein
VAGGNDDCSLCRTPFRPGRLPLDIRIVSSLAPEDEARYAAAFVKVLATFLDSLSVRYAIHAELPDGEIVEHHPGAAPAAPPARRAVRHDSRQRAGSAR